MQGGASDTITICCNLKTHTLKFIKILKTSFDIKISNRPFSGILVNLTLEQTINVNSASQRKVINYITD